MNLSKSIDDVPERISGWLSMNEIEQACREGWFSQYTIEDLIIKSHRDKWNNYWAFYIG